MIAVKNVSKEYIMGKQKLMALDNVNLSIESGDYVAIVGPSGSGKTTLMHIIGGLDRATSGEVLIDGKDISKFKDKEMANYRNKYIGFVFQNFYLEPSMTALENVMLPMMFSGLKRSVMKDRALESLEMVGLKDWAKHKPNEMSGGQRQRVSIGRALVNSPQIIFADEPTGNLDTASGENIMSILKSLNDKGHTIILVTHNLEQVKYSKRAITIRDGRILQ